MQRFFSCFKEGCARPREEGYDRDHPHGNNEFLNYLVRYNIIPRNRDHRDQEANLRFLGHPICTARMFPWQAVLDGTQNQAEANFLGKGNFGPVFRCDLPDYHLVGAAKFQDNESQAGHDEFMAEISVLHQANHQNVIKLLGTSFGRNKLALIYEYMPGSSLDRHLLKNIREPQNNPALNWEARMRIAVGVADSLRYLHNQLKMIHRDVKVQNILVDQDLVPKLTDFGLAVKIVEAENGSEIEREVHPNKGTTGCVPPETEHSALVSTKLDVYSYGALLFQLITGRKAFDSREPHETKRITHWMRHNCGEEENLPRVVDTALLNRFSVEGLNRLYEIGRMCTRAQADARPNMAQVVNMICEAATYVIPPVTKTRSL